MTVVENDSVSCRIQHTFFKDEYDTLIRYYGNRVNLREQNISEESCQSSELVVLNLSKEVLQVSVAYWVAKL